MVAALFTTWSTGFEVLPRRVESPPYTALTKLVPAGSSVEVVKLAKPPLNVPVPNTFVPFTNVAVSPSDGATKDQTFAVKVTGCP